MHYPVNIDDESILFEDQWLTRQALADLIKRKIESQDFSISAAGGALEYLQNAVANARQFQIKLAPADADRLERHAQRAGLPVGAFARQVGYENTGRLSCVSKARLEAASTAHDYQGVLNCATCTDCTDYGFDGLDRVRWVREAGASEATVRSFVYGGDLSLAMVDEESKALMTVSDGWGNIVQVVRDPYNLAQTSTYYYNAANLIRAVKDPENHSISYARNYLGKITQASLPNSHTWSFAYL